jgi:hypothetical protein
MKRSAYIHEVMADLSRATHNGMSRLGAQVPSADSKMHRNAIDLFDLDMK